MKRHRETSAIGKLKKYLTDDVVIRPEVAPAIARRMFGRGRRDDGKEGEQRVRNRTDRPD